MKIPIGKHGNITQTMPNDTSARARRARSSYKFKNATSPWREWRYPMKNPMNRKYFWLPGSVEGGRRSLPSLGRSQWSASSKRGETARPKRSKLPKMGALARMAVKRTKTVSKPPHRAPRVRGASGHPPHPFSAKVVMERENPIFGPLVAPLNSTRAEDSSTRVRCDGGVEDGQAETVRGHRLCGPIDCGPSGGPLPPLAVGAC